jgi:hypothetical protein
MKKRKTRWSRTEKLTVLGIVVGVFVAIGVALLYPDVRRTLHIEKQPTLATEGVQATPTPEHSAPAQEMPVISPATQDATVKRVVPGKVKNKPISPQQTAEPRTLVTTGGPGAASGAQMANSVHFERVVVQGAFNLSNCVSCSVEGSSIGRVKVGPGPVVLNHNSIQGGVVCEKRDPPLKDIPNDCQAVAITNSRISDTNAALDNTDGKIGEAYVSGNIVRPPVNGGDAKAVLNSHGEIQKLTETNNDVGWNSSGTVPTLFMPTALHGSNSTVADQLSQSIDSGNRIVADFLKDDNTQFLAEKETSWEGETRAILAANLEPRFADQFSSTTSTSTTYPSGHGAQGGSLCNLIDAKVTVLSTLVNQLRSARP